MVTPGNEPTPADNSAPPSTSTTPTVTEAPVKEESKDHDVKMTKSSDAETGLKDSSLPPEKSFVLVNAVNDDPQQLEGFMMENPSIPLEMRLVQLNDNVVTELNEFHIKARWLRVDRPNGDYDLFPKSLVEEDHVKI